MVIHQLVDNLTVKEPIDTSVLHKNAAALNMQIRRQSDQGELGQGSYLKLSLTESVPILSSIITLR